ncbi:MAG: gliding motility-associated ABC transporter substrate-binding protein GldG [Chitinophagaceae bacterium]|nr:gliding motility-associated ABC transporter substrate-binding protein GldG [Chitinophagaceae bacterium]
MSKIKKIGYGKLWLPLAIVLLLLINGLASLYHARIDLTNEKRFTLSGSTKTILKNIDDRIQIDVFLKGEFPSGFKKLANSTQETLQEFKEIAGADFQFNFISPDETVEGTDVQYGDTLSTLGMYPINLKSQLKAGEQQQLVYPVALVRYKGEVIPVDLYSGNKTFITPAELNSAEALMEFKFADAINKLSQTSKPMIAYSTGNGEPGDVRTYDLANNVLLKDYNLKTLNLNTQPFIPDTFKLLIIVKPTQAFTDEEKLKIDQFVMRGGKLLIFMDKLEAELDSLRIKNEVVAYDRNLELNDLLFKYGARINNDLVMDLQCDFLPFDINGNGQLEFLHWNYFPLFETKSNHIINKNVGLVSGRFVNSIDTIEAEGIKKTILLSSSSNTKTVATPALISGKENVNAPEDESFKKANIPVAVLMEGKFQSLFNNRLPKVMLDSLQDYGIIYQPQCIVDNKIIVVADGDIVLNSVYKNEPMPMGMNPFTTGSQYEYQFANKEFLQNCIGYLIDQSGLLDTKAKEYTLRVLDSKKINAQKNSWQLVNIVLPILVIIFFAVLYQWWRKRKYTRKYSVPLKTI